MVTKFIVDLSQLKKFTKRIERAIKVANDLDMDPLKEIVLDEMEIKFESGGEGSWQDITSTTTRLRPARLNGAPPLGGLEGGLFGSMQIVKGRNKNRLDIRFPHKGALALNFGAPRNRMFGMFPAPIPAREFMILSEDTLQSMQIELLQQIRERLARGSSND